jgi:3-oxoadipate enol-lactonase
MPTVNAGAVQMSYEEMGSGDPVVLIHGTHLAGADWIPQTASLSEHFRCITIDNRDVGNSAYVESAYTPGDMAEDTRAVIERLGLGSAHVIGFSLGSAVAQELAIRHPELVRSLVLIATWPASDPWFQGEWLSWQTLRRAHWDEYERFVRTLSPWLWSARTYSTPGMIDGIVAMAAARDSIQRPDGFTRQCEANAAHDATDRLGRIGAPTLVISGEEDICTPPRYARKVAELIPGARLFKIPGAAHMVFVEQADLVNGVIVDFLKSS